MREIKFRAWDKKRKKMFRVLGTSIPTYAGSEELWLRLEKYTKSSLQFPAKDFELMQFTGLTDKNSKEIYEGDIVKIKEESPVSNEDLSSEAIVKITWNDEKAGFSLDWYSNDLTVYQDLEVIGNVWENPELLEIKK